MKTDAAHPVPPKRLHTIPEIAQITGTSPRFIWDRVRRGELKARKLGRLTRVADEDLDDFLKKLPTTA